MKTVDAIKHFGKKAALARALNIERAAVGRWGEFVPYVRQHQIEQLTSGALKAMNHDEFIKATK